MADPIPPPSSTPDPPAAPVKDLRVTPRGVIPRGTQTWLLAGIALFMVLIMLVVGRPAPPTPHTTPATSASTPGQSADRVREYQERLRLAETQALAQAQAFAQQAPTTDEYGDPEPQADDPIEAEQRRREYQSLFASNVVLSRRPESERPESGQPTAPRAAADTSPDPPTLDEIAEAARRATLRATPGQAPSASVPETSGAPARTTAPASAVPVEPPVSTDPISSAGPTHRLLEGTVIDAILTNRLDGDAAAPVNCLVTNPVYSHTGYRVVIPAGARVLGETRPVQSFGERRLAVAFHRLVLPDGRTYRLDQFLGLNQVGDGGLRDRVNQHYLATFGAAAAVGLVGGLSQYLGSAGLGRGGDGDRTVVIAGGVGDATAQATLQVMNRFLNRLPTITIREGHRVKVYLTSDIELPEYVPPTRRRTIRP